MNLSTFRRKFRSKVLTGILIMLSKCSLKTLYKMAKMSAKLLIVFPNSLYKTTERNINLTFSYLSEMEKKELVEKTLVQNAATFFELSFLWLRDYKTIKKHFNPIQLPESFKNDQVNFKQMIFITPHFGSWEVSGLVASELYPLATLYRPSRLLIDNLIIEGRSKNGAKLVSTTAQGIREMMKLMKDGRSVGILPDQDPGNGEGIFSPFFGIETKTMVLVSKLAAKYKIPAYIVSSTRDMNNAKFNIELIKIDETLQSDDLQESVDTLNLAIENTIKKDPTQYLWTYKRFKSAPLNEPSRY